MNTWTTILTPTELEKEFSHKPKGICSPSKKPTHSTARKAIQVIDKKGKKTNFPSISQASIHIGISHKTILSCCNQYRPDQYGNHYRYI
ncbi:hypothetical protein [Kingella oralis]